MLRIARLARAWLAAAGLATTIAVVAMHGTADAAAWTLQGTTQQPSSSADQGLATNGSSIVYRGDNSVPFRLGVQGWDHIGDPDALGGYVYDAYESSSPSKHAKLFEVTTPQGAHYDYTHTLRDDIAEQPNNSFATVSPDGKWLVSGEWNTDTRLLVFRKPSAPFANGPLALAGTISLDTPVQRVQGCDFSRQSTLYCSSDAAGAAKSVIRIALSTDATGRPVRGAVTTAFALPQTSSCTGIYESEGIDYSSATGDLRVEVIPPGTCNRYTTIYRYRLV